MRALSAAPSHSHELITPRSRARGSPELLLDAGDRFEEGDELASYFDQDDDEVTIWAEFDGVVVDVVEPDEEDVFAKPLLLVFQKAVKSAKANLLSSLSQINRSLLKAHRQAQAPMW